MKIQAVSFDCHGTLVAVRQTVARAAVLTAERLGLTISADAESQFLSLQAESLVRFHAVNRLNDEQGSRAFWVALCSEWLRRVGGDPEQGASLQSGIESASFASPSPMFSTYDDVVPCLTGLRSRGLRLAVLSNWDASLPRVLGLLGIAPYFEVVVASLVEGVEKPDPWLFHILFERLGLEPGAILHVGDHVADDVEGAQNAGLQARYLDRDGSAPGSIPGLLALLDDPSLCQQ